MRQRLKNFNTAREFVRKLGLKNRREWAHYCSIEGLKPNNIPDDPEQAYKKHWKGWKNWLGQYKKDTFLTFEEARKEVRKLNLKSTSEWKKYCNWNPDDFGIKPGNIPASPHVYYKNKGWIGYGDWLGTNNVASFLKDYASFDEARTFARSLGLTSTNLWIEYCKGTLEGLPKKPTNIPTNVSRKYRNHGWKGMDDFLNAGHHRKMKRLNVARGFEEARAFVHELKLKNLKEWHAYVKGEIKGKKKKPKDIPNSPELVYKDFGWQGYGDWLGTFTIAPFKREYRNFEEAREFARSLGLTSSEKWIEYCKGAIEGLPPKPDDIPTNVSRKYKNEGWISYKDFLWSNIHRRKYSKFLPYEEAKAFVNKLGLDNYKEWHAYIGGKRKDLPQKPKNIPSNPAGVYKNKGWTGIGDWLGSDAFPYAHEEYRSFKDARKFARALGLTSSIEWIEYCKGNLTHLPEKPSDIPANVVRKYEDKGWKGFKDFLWSDKHRKARKAFKTFDEAKDFVADLNLKNAKQWSDYANGKLKKSKGLKPVSIPADPEAFYKRKGWSSMKDFLGLDD